MPPTLTTAKSSPEINAPRFSIITKALGGETTDGRRRFSAIASSTITDRAGDEISVKALQQMRDKFREGITIFTDHENKVANAFGTTDYAEIVEGGTDPKTGNRVWDLKIAGGVNEPNPTAVQLHDSISGGFVKLGCSIDAFVLDHAKKSAGGLAIEGLDVFAASIVGVPMNQRSWTQKAVRAIKSFYGEPEEDETVPPDQSAETETIEKAADEVSTDIHTADTPAEAAPEAAEATETAEEVEKAAMCPTCGKADGDGCEDDFHNKTEKSVDSASVELGGQESVEETPETAPAANDETDTPAVEKALIVEADVVALVKQAGVFVTEISRLRDENAELKTKVAELEGKQASAQEEIEDAKDVIERVMKEPLRRKAIGELSAFADRFPQFDPEIVSYLTKSKETHA